MELPPIEWNDSIDKLDEEGINDYLLEQQAVKEIEEDLHYNFI